MASATPARKAAKTAEIFKDESIGKQAPSKSPDPLKSEDGPQEDKPTIYTIALTALNFTTFLLSLLIVETHYTVRRATLSASSTSLGRLFFRHQDAHNQGTDGYYHSNQKKLFRMEAEDAFKLRNRTLVIIGGFILGMLGFTWWIVRWAYGMLVKV